MARRRTTLKLIPLGGLGEIGKNMTVVEYGNDIVVIDCGLTFPDEDMPGVDVVIPDINYLEKNREKLRGVAITHGHEDHYGAVPYLLKKLDVNIYATELTLGLLKNKFKEHNLSTKHLKTVRPGMKVKLGCFEVEFIRVSHSIPDSCAIAVHTPVGPVIFTGDFKIDFTPIDGDLTDLPRLAELGKEGVLALLADSTNVERPGYTLSERTVGETFKQVFSKAKARIIVATFASNLHRAQQVIYAAEHFGRKVVLSGRSMVNNVNIALELGYLKAKKGTIVDLNNLNRYDDDEIVLLTTGSQGEPMSALTRMAYGEHRKVSLRPTDTVILSASPIPGNETTVGSVINKLMQAGVEVIYQSLADVHVSGHACQEELKLIHSLVKPRFFIPVHGEERHLVTHAKLAETMGMDRNNIKIGSIGTVFELTRNSMEITGTVPAGNILVDGLGVGDVGSVVLRDRRHLAEDGLIIVIVTISKQENKVIAGPDIVSRGFVYVKESGDLMEEAKRVVETTLKSYEGRRSFDWSTLKNNIRDDLKRFVYGQMKRNPMILPVIVEA